MKSETPSAVRVCPIIRDASWRAGLEGLLTGVPDLACDGSFGELESALPRVQRAPPDVVILDLALAQPNVAECVRRVNAAGPNARVLLLVQRPPDPLILASLLDADADGILGPEELAPDALLQALRDLDAAGYFLPRWMQDSLAHAAVPTEGHRPQPDAVQRPAVEDSPFGPDEPSISALAEHGLAVRSPLARSDAHPGVLLDDSKVQAQLRAIVAWLEPYPTEREDLLQVARLRLWHEERHNPGQTRSWHLNNCLLYLQNYRRLGRSVDAGKRRSSQVELPPETDTHAPFGEMLLDDAALSRIYADDWIDVLRGALAPPEQEVFDLLCAGHTLRDIARRLKVSHVTVIERRRKIQAVALRLGISPPAN